MPPFPASKSPMGLILLLTLSFPGIILGLNVTEFIEKPNVCFSQPFKIINDLDLEWFQSVDMWYTVMWNKGELYRLAEEYIGKKNVSMMSEEEVYDSACVYMYNPDSKGRSLYKGFGKTKHQFFNIMPQRPGVTYYTDENDEFLFDAFPVANDRSTFAVNINVWRDGARGFVVYSPQPTISDEAFIYLRNLMAQHGFYPGNIIPYSYSNCSPP